MPDSGQIYVRSEKNFAYFEQIAVSFTKENNPSTKEIAAFTKTFNNFFI
jgi:hypothetical protein